MERIHESALGASCHVKAHVWFGREKKKALLTDRTAEMVIVVE